MLDVGPDMHPYLDAAGRNLFNLATARVRCDALPRWQRVLLLHLYRTCCSSSTSCSGPRTPFQPPRPPKVLNKPVLEMAVIYFGTTGERVPCPPRQIHAASRPTTQPHPTDPPQNQPDTDNDLNREFAAQGDPGQYTSVVVARELACSTVETMAALADVPRGQGVSDWVNALLVSFGWQEGMNRWEG